MATPRKPKKTKAPAELKKPEMQSGYAQEYEGDDKKWRTSSVECWTVEMYSPKGNEHFLGGRSLDGAMHGVWRCDDGKLRAQKADLRGLS